MIKFTENKNEIIALWHTVFGDSEAEINYFLENCKHRACLGYFEGEKLLSMLFLVDCEYGGVSGKYIYAVATYEQCRGRGYASALVDFAKGAPCGFLWLIPANEGLINYYENLGFKPKFEPLGEYKENIVFNEIDGVKSYLYEGCELKKPVGVVYFTSGEEF